MAEERHAAGSGWFLDNAARPPGACVLQYVLDGALYFRSESQVTLVRPGNAVLMRFGDDSAYGLEPSGEFGYGGWYVTLLGAGLAEHWQALIQRHGPVVGMAPSVQDHALALIAAADAPRTTSAAQLCRRIHELVLALDEGLYDLESGPRSPVDQAVEDMLRDPLQPWNLKSIAQRHGISREHLSRVFGARTGQTPQKWLSAARLEHAQTLLTETSLTVSEIARRCGYASARVLARNLQECCGRSPNSWRVQRS